MDEENTTETTPNAGSSIVRKIFFGVCVAAGMLIVGCFASRRENDDPDLAEVEAAELALIETLRENENLLPQ